MQGFFVTVNCSEVFDSNENSYKIFIDKNKMSIVYELIQWIRFMFSLERCFFLIHESSVIHELEDIKVLEILKSLEIRLCLRSNCIHKKMEKNLFNKLDLFTYWNGMRVHKLLETRLNHFIQKVPHNHHHQLDIEKTSNVFTSLPQNNFLEEVDKTELGINQHAVTPPLKLTYKLEDDRSQIIKITKEDLGNENQLDLKKVNTAISNNSTNCDENDIKKKFFNQNLESLTHPNSVKLNSCTKDSALSSSLSKKQKILGYPFSVGALLANIREKAQNEECKEKYELNHTESFNSICLASENTEDKMLPAKKANLSQSNDSRELKRKRKRKSKKQIRMVNFDDPPTNLSWDYFEPLVNVKPNHIRFNDSDELMEPEIVENNCNSSEKRTEDFSSLEVSSDINQKMVAPQLTTEFTPLVKGNESNCPVLIEDQDEICEKLIDLNCANKSDNVTEKNGLDDTQQNLPDIESLKQKIKHPKICLRFY